MLDERRAVRRLGRLSVKSFVVWIGRQAARSFAVELQTFARAPAMTGRTMRGLHATDGDDGRGRTDGIKEKRNQKEAENNTESRVSAAALSKHASMGVECQPLSQPRPLGGPTVARLLRPSHPHELTKQPTAHQPPSAAAASPPLPPPHPPPSPSPSTSAATPTSPPSNSQRPPCSSPV